MQKKFFKFWLPVIIWSLVIFYFSGLPVVKITEFYWQDFIVKKSAHLGEYFIFFVLLYRAIKNSRPLSPKKAFIWAFIFLILYAISDEIHQSFTPGREPRMRDVMVDGLGGLMALWVLKYKLAKMPKKLQLWAKNWQID